MSSDAENCIIALPSYKGFNLASQVVLKSFLSVCGVGGFHLTYRRAPTPTPSLQRAGYGNIEGVLR